MTLPYLVTPRRYFPPSPEARRKIHKAFEEGTKPGSEMRKPRKRRRRGELIA